MKAVTLLIAMTGMLLGLNGCFSPSPVKLQSLEELSPEQLRVWLRGHPGDWRKATDQARGLPEPPALKPVPTDAQRIDLAAPDLQHLGQRSVAEVMAHRRSRRTYDEVPLKLDEVGFLLWSAQGISGADLDEEGGVQRIYRTVPSAGGRQPLETYLFVNRVDGLTSGLYRYLAAEHQLILLRPGTWQTALLTACYGSTAVEQAAVVVVWTALPYRMEWKYGVVSHRMIAMEAGHACQNLYLASEALNLGTCAISAYDQRSLDQLLSVDGQEEFALYMATIGHPKEAR